MNSLSVSHQTETTKTADCLEDGWITVVSYGGAAWTVSLTINRQEEAKAPFRPVVISVNATASFLNFMQLN